MSEEFNNFRLERYMYSSSPDEGERARILRLAEELQSLLGDKRVPAAVKQNILAQPWSKLLLGELAEVR